MPCLQGHAPEPNGPDVEGQPADRQQLLAKHVSSSGKPAYAPDRALVGLAFYALSSVFLATMLVAAKLLGKRSYPTWQTLLARSSIIMMFALAACAKQRKNPFGNRQGQMTGSILNSTRCTVTQKQEARAHL